jgi:1,5-anhydro-D-fructose reductase (1,5-anhydro-D-mannitol-forming)
MTEKNGWGLVGTGRIAEERILPAINGFVGNELVAVVSRDAGRATSFAERFRARTPYTSYEQMLRDHAISVVAIHTPNSLHAEQAVAAARAGKHVFCDKPMATSVPDAQRIVAECERAGVKLGVNFHNRFMPCFIDCRRIIAAGEIGDVLQIQIEASPGLRVGERQGTWRLDPELAGLGTTMSIGVHIFDILRYLLAQEVESVSSMFDTPRGVMEQVNLTTLRFRSGTMAQVSIHENAPFPHNDLVIYGSQGRITGRGVTRSRTAGELEVFTGEGPARRTRYPVTNAHAACVEAFSEALLEGLAPAPCGIDGLRSVQLTEAMARSAWDGVLVNLPG